MKTGLRRTVPVLAMSLLLGATLAACGTASDEVEPTVTRIDVPGAPPTRTATLADDATPEPSPDGGSPVDQASPTGDSGNGGGATELEVDMVDLAFEPKELTVVANTDVTVTLINKGVLEHNFSVIDQTIDSGSIPGGGQGSVVVNLPPGTYEYHCNIPGHTEAGMVGTLIVQ